ncbi:MAG: manganese transporter [Pirellulaceae bacterium]|nr:MAG: manganese transporter [Pirellulaceae bacterium]
MLGTSTSRRPWYRRIGPSLITACVVIGPGSIMTSSQIGATAEYSLLWVVALAMALMLLFMTMGARLGVSADASPAELIRRKAGRPLAILVGCGVFFIAAAFQSGNNIGVASALAAWLPSTTWVVVALLVLNGLAIAFLFTFDHLYRALERVMATFVGAMLIAFAYNLLRLKPDWRVMVHGFVPRLPAEQDMMTVLGLIGTSFVITAAFYQAYLVRQKGWQESDLPDGLLDTRIGTLVMFLITVMLMSTAAAGLYGKGVALDDPLDVAIALEGSFGPSAKALFCIGLFCAAYSSFLINSMIGGFMAADALGWGARPQDLAPRLLTTAALVSGMLIGIAVLIAGFDRTPTIIMAQAATIIVAPLIAATLLWLTSSPDVMGERVNGWTSRCIGVLGVLLLVAMAGKTAIVDLPPKVRAYWEAHVRHAVPGANEPQEQNRPPG